MPEHRLSEEELAVRRTRMVEEQIFRRGVTDEAVLAAMRTVPRHRFVPQELMESAYEDSPLPIGWGQTISQPYIVASMTEQLRLTRHSRVLEVGTGSGYQTAVLAELSGEVYSIELIPELANQAAQRLATVAHGGVTTRIGDGTDGWPEAAPFDAIMVTAAATEIPSKLLHQLGMNGRMILPVRLEKTDRQMLVLAGRTESGFFNEALYGVRFVPLQRGH